MKHEVSPKPRSPGESLIGAGLSAPGLHTAPIMGGELSMTEKLTGIITDTATMARRMTMPLKPGQVFEQQANLHHALANSRGPNGTAPFHLANFICGFARRVAKVTAPAYETEMFYPYHPSDGLEQAALWCGDVAKGLFQAQAYQVTAEMVDAVSGVYEQSVQGLFHIEEASLPSPQGFIWLDKPMIITDKWGRRVAERAITWSLVTTRVKYPNAGYTDGFGRAIEPPVVHEPGIRLSTWSSIEDDRILLKEAQDTGQPTGYEEEFGITGEQAWDYLWDEWDTLKKVGDLSLSHSLVVLFGERHQWSYGKAPHPEKAVGDFQPDNLIAWIYALWSFMGTEIVTMPRARADRHSLRRAKSVLKQNEVNIVLLRRSRVPHLATDTGEGEHREIDWSCRWLVTGHYRHIDGYLGDRHHAAPRSGLERTDDGHDWCGICWQRGETARISWIAPYLKGPESAPLKASKQLHKLVR